MLLFFCFVFDSFRVIVNVKYCSVVLKTDVKNIDICRVIFEDETMCMGGEALSYISKIWTKLKVRLNIVIAYIYFT